VTGAIQKQVAVFKSNTTGLERYNPFFMNDAAFDQNVLGSYRDYEDLRDLQSDNDPDGMFNERIGGFKY
jgi:hypothetical protein